MTIEAGRDLSGKVLITCSMPMNASDTALVIARTSSGAEALAKKARKAKVVSAFGTVPSEVLFDVFAAKRRSSRRPSLLYCGNDDQAKRTAARLIRNAGFEPVDAGPLKIARYLEPFTLAIAQLAYESDQGPEIAYRIERFGK
jgi:predicted dinucleotide-binding enzyme